jgi:hypothetical protein
VNIRQFRRAACLTAAAFLCWGLGACAPFYYHPAIQTVPLFTKKGAFIAGVSGSSNLVNWHAAPHLAIATTEHTAVLVSGTFGRMGNTYHRTLFQDVEAGAGAHFLLPYNLVLEAYGLYGHGSVKMQAWSQSEDGWAPGSIRADYNQVSLQPSLGWKSADLEAALSVKVSEMEYTREQGEYLEDGLQARGERIKARLLATPKMTLVEPAVTFRNGKAQEVIPGLRLQIQIGFSRNLTDPDFRQLDHWFSVGCVYSFEPAR